MIGILNHAFFQNAIIAGIFASIIFGIIGTLVVINRIVFISGGISHASFGGIGMSLYLGLDPLIGATIFAVGSALGIGTVGKKSIQRQGTTIGITWAVGMAIGALFYHITPGYLPPAENFLFGNILMIQNIHVVLIAIFSLVTVLSVALFYRKIQAVSFDEEFSKILGISSNRVYLLLLVMVSIAIVLLIRVVGIILLIAMMSIPPTIAGFMTKDMKEMMGWSVVFSLFFILTGLWLSYTWGTPAGPTIVILAGGTFLITYVQNKFSKQ